MKFYFTPIALLVATTLAGCSSIPENNPSLNEARNDYNTAQSNPQVVQLAPSELKQASDAMEKANAASTQNEDPAVVAHLAYLAKQRSAIAQETAKQKSAEVTLENAESERNQIRLKARTADADQSKLEAESSQRMTEAAQLQAAIAQQKALTSQQQYEDSSQKNAELEAQLVALNAKKTDRGIVITIGDVLFDTNKAAVKASGTPNLLKIGQFLKKYPDRTARVEGYTDSTGSAEYNQGLSDRRAKAVRSTLVSMGISDDRITSEGFGQESPVGDNQTALGRQMNRRVEIVLPNEYGDSSQAK